MARYDMSTREYWDQRDAKLAADVSEAHEYARSPMGRLEAMRRQVNGAEYFDPEQAKAIRAEIRAYEAHLEAEDDASFEAEWTRETTVARRAVWNAWAGEHRNATPLERSRHEHEVGFCLVDLKRAILIRSL